MAHPRIGQLLATLLDLLQPRDEASLFDCQGRLLLIQASLDLTVLVERNRISTGQKTQLAHTAEDIRLGIHRQRQSQVALPPEAVQRKQVGP